MLKNSMALYVVTDRTWLGENKLENQVEEIIKNGATFIQLREKELSFEEFLNEGKKIKEICKKHKVPFVINDNIEIAKALDADGVHVGQSDMEVLNARKILGNDKIIGVSARTLEEALIAEKNGADYLGVGAVFGTTTKLDASNVSHETLKDITSNVKIPVVAIGGINENNILGLKGSGIDGVAVISAIFAKEDISFATREMFNLVKEIIL